MPSNRSDNLQNFAHRKTGGETPRSPRELDDHILQRARQKAEEYARYSDSTGFKWLGDGWKTAAAVFSVAVVAISVTIQVYDDSRTTPFSVTDAIPVTERASLETASPEAVVLTTANDDQPRQANELQFYSVQREAVADAGAQQQQAAVADNVGASARAEFQSAASPAVARSRTAAASVAELADPADLPDLSDLESILESITILEPVTSPDEQQQRTFTTRTAQLGVVLEVIEDVFGESSIAVEPYAPPTSPPSVDQLANKAAALINSYRAVTNSGQQDLLESAYQQRISTSGAVEISASQDRAIGFPATLATTINVLANWLSGRE